MRARPLLVARLGVMCLAALSDGFAGGAVAASASPSSVSPWSVYHGDPAGSGVAADITSVTTTTAAWTSATLDGQLYGEPLGLANQIIVATENDTVYALDAATGSVNWSTHVGTPVPSSSLPCGDISPTVGITGTPVIDPAKGEVFVVADEFVNGAPQHQLVGLSTTTGQVELTQSVDPPGSTPAALLQRTGLTLDRGRVLFGFGGNFGDCGSYKGWVVSVPESGGTPADFAVDAAAGESQGAIWMGGAAPAVDGSGDIWVSAGNGSVTSPSHAYDDSDSVLELSPALTLLQYFAPTTWASDNSTDLDFSTSPALLSDGQVVIAGKSRIVFLLNGTRLAGIGGQEASLLSGCHDVIDGGMAVVGQTVFLPCRSGIEAVDVALSPPSLHLQWSSSLGSGPPIVAAGLVWTIAQDGELYGLNTTTGQVQQQANVGPEANHFPTPGVGAGHLLVPSADRVVAFSASASGSTSTSTSSTASSTSTTNQPSTPHGSPPTKQTTSGGLSTGAIAGIVAGALVVGTGIVVFFIGRRRRRSNTSAME